MTANTLDRRDHTFWFGLLAGSLVGAGLAIVFLPRAAALRQQLTDAARDLSTSASDGYRQASTRVDEAVDELTRRGQTVRHAVASTIVDGAHAAERIAAAIEAPRPIAVEKS